MKQNHAGQGRFTGRTAIVTGASRGIGLAIAERLVLEGARVCLTARKAGPLEEAAATLPRGSVITVAGKADNPGHRREVFDAVAREFGMLDVLVNNAGINPAYGPVAELDLDVARKVLEVNVLAALAWVQGAVARQDLRFVERNGTVVNLSSVTGQTPSPGIGLYGVTKAAVSHLTRTLAVELAPEVRVNAVAPAVVKTRFAEALYEGKEDEVSEAYPLGRLGVPSDIASAVAYLASDDSSWVTAMSSPSTAASRSPTAPHDERTRPERTVMTFTHLPTETEKLRQRTRRFIREVVVDAEPAPGERLDQTTRARLQAAAKDAGVFAPHVPKEYGGQGVPIEHWSPILQEAGYSPIGPSALNCMAPDEGNMHMLNVVATEDQKQRYLVPLAAGEIRSCFGMTEPHPGAGSDPAALQTSASRTGGGWIIDGHKRFTSGAIGAGFCIVMARTPATGDGPEGATMFLVDMTNPGIRVGEAIHTVDRYIDGGHPHLHLQNCFVPDEAVLGGVGLGFRYAQVRLGPARLTHCMRWLGLARRAFDIALDRAETRELFGGPINSLGLAQNLIAESVIDIETSDALITKTAALLHEDPKTGSAMSSVAKVHCSEAIFRVVDRAIQICGGDGVSDGLPLAQYLNEVRPFRIYDGPNETHRWAIARRTSSSRKAAVQAGERHLGDTVVRHGNA
ncbi:glucose 1-dehydrogenase [Streptomyces sp. NPDC088746]|uniref:glucose 1-dehydrogenase n=1 Tax=Streptomyces sp. NPDC088746 TaxID=3365885 RepID=UPI00381892C8